jgi:hypothetical protein
MVVVMLLWAKSLSSATPVIAIYPQEPLLTVSGHSIINSIFVPDFIHLPQHPHRLDM